MHIGLVPFGEQVSGQNQCLSVCVETRIKEDVGISCAIRVMV